MSNLSDKELDRLSREAAEHYEPDEDISSWDKLEQTLNREITDKPPGSLPRLRNRPIIYGSLVLLLGGISYFLIKTITHTKQSTLQTQVSTKTNNQEGTAEKNLSDKTDKDQKGAIENKSANSTNKDNQSGQPVSGSNSDVAKEKLDQSEKISNAHADKVNSDINNNQVNTPAAKNAIDANADKKSSGKEIVNGGINHDAATNNSLNNRSTNSQNKGAKNHKNKSNPATGSGIAAGITATNNGLSQNEAKKTAGKDVLAGNNSENEMKSAVLPGIILSDRNVGEIDDASLRKLATKTSRSVDSVSAPKQSQALHIRKPLKIGVMFAPDYTNVGSATNNQFSSNIGITLGYEFENRWSVNSGIIYTAKNYAANGKDFKVEWVITPNNYHLDFVNGSCYMIEIPLTLRYDFSVTKKTIFFVNGGLSSYLMKNEAYTFHYHYYYYNPPGTTSGSVYKTYPGNENYWLGVASLSAGMERQLGKNFSLQVEPFIKVPLSGVGIGNLQLNSYGLSFSLRYAPVLGRSRH